MAKKADAKSAIGALAEGVAAETTSEEKLDLRGVIRALAEGVVAGNTSKETVLALLQEYGLVKPKGGARGFAYDLEHRAMVGAPPAGAQNNARYRLQAMLGRYVASGGVEEAETVRRLEDGRLSAKIVTTSPDGTRPEEMWRLESVLRTVKAVTLG